MHRERHLFERVVDFDNLYRAFLSASAGKRDRPEVIAFEFDLERHLWEIRRELQGEAYQWGAYRRFVIRDPKMREIRAAPFRDRVVHHALFNVIDAIFTRGFITDSFACIPGRGSHRAAERYRAFVRARRGEGYALQCDIRAYFASVDHEVLTQRLGRRIADRRLLAVLRSLVQHGAEKPGKGMPIGNLTSQLFANLYLDAFDHFIKEQLRVRHYVRYMDDFILLLDDRASARVHLATVRQFLAEVLQLELNPRRITIAPIECSRDVLGYVHRSDGRIRVRRRSVKRLWHRLPGLEEGVENGRVSPTSARASVGSWFGLARHANAFRLSRAIFSQRDVRNAGKRLLSRPPP